MSRNYHDRRSRSPSLDHNEDADYQLALKLSAELNGNGEQSAPPTHHQPGYDADVEFARAMQLAFDNELQAAKQHNNSPNTGPAWEAPATISPGPSAWGLGKADSKTTDYHPEAPSETVPKGFADFITYLKSHKCKCGEQVFRSELDIMDMFQKWLNGKGPLSSWIKCRSCLTSSCVGCTPEPFAKPSTVSFQGKQVSWCCAGGRVFLIWILLCGFDQQFCAMRSKEAMKTKPTQQQQTQGHSKVKTNQKTRGSGVGFGGSRRFAPSHMPNGMGHGNHFAADLFEELGDLADQLDFHSQPNPFFNMSKGRNPYPRLQEQEDGKSRAQSAQKAEDEFNTTILELLKDLLPSLDRNTGFDIDPPEAVTDMLVDSKILNYCAELLRNDSLDDATKRKELYHALLSFLRTIGMHVMANLTLFCERPIRPDAVNLLALSFGSVKGVSKEMAPSLADSLRNLNTQSVLVLQSAKNNEKDFHSEDGQNLLLLCREISELAQYILAYTSGELANSAATSAADLAISDVPDDQILATHKYASTAKSLKVSPPGRFKRLITEITTLKTGLPPGIFVRYCENRPDILKVAIIGPGGTPYENGVFEFDFFCCSSYPNKPPSVSFKGTGGGRVSINPNLYPDGKVCLSLLGTWSGEPWKPGESTLLQVVISLQAMIFCDEPWYNEPGRERSYHFGSDDDSAAVYNQKIREHTVRYAMLTWLDQPPQLWKPVIDYHFKANANKILQTASQWAKTRIPTQTGRYRYDGVGEIDYDFSAILGQGSINGDLASMLPQLQTALQEFGATYVIQNIPEPAVRQPAPPRPQLTMSYPTPLEPPPPYQPAPPLYPPYQLGLPLGYPTGQGRGSFWGSGHHPFSGASHPGGDVTNAMSTTPNSRGGYLHGTAADFRGRYRARPSGDGGGPTNNAPPRPHSEGSRGRGEPATRRGRGGRGGLGRG